MMANCMQKICKEDKKIGLSFLLKPLLGADVNRIGFSSLRSDGLSVMIQILLRGAYPKTYRRFAAPGLFVHSLLNASIQRSFTKTPLRLHRKVFVNRIGLPCASLRSSKYSCEVLTQRLIAASRLPAFLFIRF